MIKEKIRYTGVDLNLTFKLDNNNDLIDYQQEIDNLTQTAIDESINGVIDQEERRFRPSDNFIFTFNLYDATTNTFSTNLTQSGFNPTEIQYNNDNVLNSFFIIDFYDSIDPNTQNRIFTSYMTKVNINNGITVYNVNNTNQFNYFYIPLSYINSQTGTTVSGFTKFSFYNAKTGSIKLFRKNVSGDNSIQKMYFNTSLNLNYRTWSINTPTSPNIFLIEEIKSIAYINRINNGVTNFNNKKQVYNSGNTFNFKNGQYETL